MLTALFGNETSERILLYLARNDSSYASRIAAQFGYGLTRVQKQLDRLEQGAVLVSTPVGRTRVYRINPRWICAKELLALLKTALDAIPEDERVELFTERKRPRKKGKPLWPSRETPKTPATSASGPKPKSPSSRG